MFVRVALSALLLSTTAAHAQIATTANATVNAAPAPKKPARPSSPPKPAAATKAPSSSSSATVNSANANANTAASTAKSSQSSSQTSSQSSSLTSSPSASAHSAGSNASISNGGDSHSTKVYAPPALGGLSSGPCTGVSMGASAVIVGLNFGLLDGDCVLLRNIDAVAQYDRANGKRIAEEMLNDLTGIKEAKRRLGLLPPEPVAYETPAIGINGGVN
jgi:hypothetical protein